MLFLVVFCFLIFASYPQFPVSEALFALSFSFLSERFFFIQAKADLAYSQIKNNTGVSGRI